ncbi:hypothetical protein RCJ22_37675, partial [Vibrio sp. FNV 38]|nr:hypothetical protein [Vibrio sp. FNV 38]
MAQDPDFINHLHDMGLSVCADVTADLSGINTLAASSVDIIPTFSVPAALAELSQPLPELVYYDVLFCSAYGGAPAPAQALEGSTLEYPGDLYDDSYIFTGWYIDEAAAMPYDFTAPVT